MKNTVKELYEHKKDPYIRAGCLGTIFVIAIVVFSIIIGTLLAILL